MGSRVGEGKSGVEGEVKYGVCIGARGNVKGGLRVGSWARSLAVKCGGKGGCRLQGQAYG